MTDRQKKISKIVNTVFIVLLAVTVLLGLIFCALVLLEDKNDENKIFYALAVIVLPFLAFIIFSNELLLWQSTYALLTNPHRKPIFIIAYSLQALISVTALIYLICGFLGIFQLNYFFFSYVLCVQILCQCVIWITKRTGSRRQPPV